MKSHSEICIQFELGGQPFEAVGFLNAGENSTAGEEALRRTDNGHIVRSDADWRFVCDHRAELPKELNSYWLATARPGPVDPRCVSCLYRFGAGWCGDWGGLGGPWSRGGLVLRRRMS